MAKTKTVYSCQQCGAQSPKWLGKCPDCNQWNTFAEEMFSTSKNDEKSEFFSFKNQKAIPITEISLKERQRHRTGISEFDRVLGGGVVPGTLNLVGGDPGIGKSTLIIQVLDRLATSGLKVLYVTGEESQEQIKLRGDRLGIHSSILVVAENSIEKIIDHAQKIKPDVLVVDSIQTVYLSSLESAPGSVSQVRESAGKLLYFSKVSSTATFLVGHVTKEGSLAGPRVLEHMVDCVLYFEGDNSQHFRILRTIKNRYGSTNEIGVFEMTQKGLLEVTNPSSLFLPDRGEMAIGSTVTTSLEGVRPFLVEIQALVSQSTLANPRRTTVGVDSGRVSILIAVLEKVAGLNLYGQDIYVTAAGGFKVIEPAADCAILAALASSFKNRPIRPKTLFIGEVALSGQLRAVQGAEIRLKEAAKMGFELCILPKNNVKLNFPSNCQTAFVESIADVLEFI